MTIVVGVAAPDGIILAADSRTTWMVGDHHRVGSDSTQKVFPICDRIGVATYGDAFLSDRTIAGLMDEFVAHLDEPKPTEADVVARELAAFFDERVRAAYTSEDVEGMITASYYPLGFLVAGYDEDGIGRIREVDVPGSAIADHVNTAELGVAWRGQTDVIRRLIKGFDWDKLELAGVPIPVEMNNALEELEYNLQYPITLQDAVDLATFLIRTTVDMQRFSDGTIGRTGEIPGCGGPIRVLAVTRAGADWVAEPPLPLAPGRGGVAEASLERR